MPFMKNETSRRQALSRLMGPSGIAAAVLLDHAPARAQAVGTTMHASVGEGETATRDGQMFLVHSSDGTIHAYLRTAAGSIELSALALIADLNSRRPGEGRDLIGEPSVSDLLASSAKPKGAGNIWHADGYVFVEASAEDGDQTVTTAGGTKLYAQPRNGDISARQMGVVAGRGIDNTSAVNGTFDYCARNGYRAVLDGHIEVSDTLTFRTSTGRGNPGDANYPEKGELLINRGAQIVMTADDKPILRLWGRGITTSDINLKYAKFQPQDHKRAVGVLFKDLSFAEIGHLDVRDANVAFQQDWNSGERDFFFDNHIRALRALRYSRAGVILHPNNEGNTPNTIDGISCIAPLAGGAESARILRSAGTTTVWQQGIEHHVWFNGCRGLKVGKVNVESAATSVSLIFADLSPDIDIGTIHFEAVGLLAKDAAFLKVHRAGLRIGGISIYDFDTGQAGRLAEATSLLSVITDGYFDIGVLEVSGKHRAGTNVSRVIVGQAGGHRIGKIFDNVRGGAASLLFDNRGRPTSLYTGSEVARKPMISEFNGTRIEPSFWARGLSGAVTTGKGPLPVATVDDNCGGYDGAGTFFCPQAGLYMVTARAHARPGSDATFVIRRGNDILARWSHLTASSSSAAERNSSNEASATALLNVGDQITFELESGAALIDNRTWFSAVFLSG